MHSLEILHRINARPDPVERGIPIRQMTLLIKTSCLAQSYPGGVAGFLATHLAREYEHLVRYISMSSGEIQQVLDGLIAVGVDINQACAIADFRIGPVMICPGIDFYTTSMPAAKWPLWEARLLVPVKKKGRDSQDRPQQREPEQLREVAAMSVQSAAAYFESLPKVKEAIISRFPHLVVNIMNSVFQYETIAIGEGEPKVEVGCRRTCVRHLKPFEADGTISSACRALLIDGVKECVQKSGFRMCIVWGEDACSYVEKSGEVIECVERPRGGFSLVPDSRAFKSQQAPDGTGEQK
ncbi:MAG: hypothetical protein IT501_03655 [Rubrivivax sp.]|nr:hypothetical protein [Rubrivivax sp.]